MPPFQKYLYDPDDPNLVAKVEQDIPEFKFPCPDKEKIIRYTIMVYDPHSDLSKLFSSDFLRKKFEAAQRAGFTLGMDGKFDPWVEDCMVGANEQYNSALVEYVTRFNVADLPGYVMYREVFFSEMKAALTAQDSALKKTAVANAEIARTRLAELEQHIFSGVETLEIRSALYVKAEKMKLSLRPEDVAMQIERKELKVKDPYYPKKKPGRPGKFNHPDIL